MSEDLLRRMRGLSAPEWFAGKSGSPEALEAMEREFELRLPDDYRQLMLFSNGGGLYEHATSINLEPAETLMWHNLDERFRESLPGMFVIGDDGGGSLYFYDPRNQLGQGAYSIFLVPLGTLSLDKAFLVGHSISEVIERIMAGEDLFAGYRSGDR
jgi:SMI1 / KNR4 family (SUKH-1)